MTQLFVDGGGFVAGAGAIETPLRWLLENMQDDGSGMLMMDAEVDQPFLTNLEVYDQMARPFQTARHED